MVIDDYLTLSVTDIKAAGFLAPNATVTGVYQWRAGSSVSIGTRTTGVPFMQVAYTCNGQQVNDIIYLRFKRSNLNPDSDDGYYYFVCPVTKQICRKLYLVDGHFISRLAFRPLYRAQTYSRKQREGWRAALSLISKISDVEQQRYRRERYRGKLTPYGRRLLRLTGLVEAVMIGGK